MGSFSGLGIGLSFVFGCILMGLVAEVYYLLWWKKRAAISTTSSSSSTNSAEIEDFSALLCWKKLTSFHTSSSSQELGSSVRNPQEQQDMEMGSSKDLGLKGCNEEGVETELMRTHNLCGPPRFLFTIKEESKEDLESDDGKSRKGSRTRSLSTDLFDHGTPFLSPLSSPSVKIPHSLDSYNNPLFESLSEAELGRFRSSPPPKFKFLKDAEDKLLRRLLVEEAERKRAGLQFQESKMGCREEDKGASFVTFINRNLVRDSASQVLPLSSSPTFQHSD
ncbi:hypothetical protein Salat_0444800 [Sesamum alatum]|uniref:Membrane lipoprotein n=1 Tax=Sesamum alatum TaxID=300844 RepID=A0AAE1Z3G8_9LAMI|nr:hypothetical protein Salat_0444800 [Sesamum alatum]